MHESLLKTKLYMPQPSAIAVERQQLITRMNEGLAAGCRLTLLSAPAGYGKTTLLSTWLATHQASIGWLSLDAEDNDPIRFWTYVVVALRTVQPDFARAELDLLQGSLERAFDQICRNLINQATLLSGQVVLVLDDYHHVECSSVHEHVSFLLNHLPPQFHLVISTREDPPLPLAQMRANGQVLELRSKDLRFTLEETSEFLTRKMRLALSPEDVVTLEQRTEGWIAGLQMAALSMQHLPDSIGFVQAFAGHDRYIADYLIAEVIERQPMHIRDFLMRTAILKQLTAPLCDAVTGSDTGREDLAYLEKANLFLMSLDNRRQWYRYHHLFGELLQIRCEESLGSVGMLQLHRQAADWYERQGLLGEAIDHALSARDFERASSLIEQAAMTTLFGNTQWATLLSWMQSLPTEVVQAQPRLSLTFAWALFTSGRWEKAEPFLRNVELSVTSGPGINQCRPMLAEVITLRALIAYESGDVSCCLKLATEALKALPPDNQFIRCVALLAQGMAHLWLGDSWQSRSACQAAFALGNTAGNTTVAIISLGYLTQLEVRQGHLQEAARCADQARMLGTHMDGTLLGPTGLALVQMGEVLRERNELRQAAEVLTQAVKLSKGQTGMPEYVFEGLITLARVQFAAGAHQEAERTVAEAEHLLNQLLLRSGDVRPILRMALEYRVRLWLETGNVALAARWLVANGLRPNEEPSIGQEGLSVLLARTLLMQGQDKNAAVLLDKLLAMDEVQGTIRLAVEGLALRAVAQAATGKEAEAEASLGKALLLAEPEGYVRLFIGAGRSMMHLLDRLLRQGTSTPYVERLRAAVTHPRRSQSTPALVEPLAEPELRILRLMAAGLSHSEIASEICRSVNTVKWHTTHIYRKLGVSRRAHAIAHARELGYL